MILSKIKVLYSNCHVLNTPKVVILIFFRYVFLCRHHVYLTIFTQRKTIIYCFCLWIISTLIELPNITGWGGHTYDLKSMACSYDRLADISYTYFFVSVGVSFPCLVVCITYFKIYKYVKSIRKELEEITGNVLMLNGTNKNKTRQQEELQLARTLFIVCIVFLVCWSPYVILVLIDHNDSWSKIAYVITVQMAHTSSSVNSILYGSTNQRFRRGYKNIIQKAVCSSENHQKTLTDNLVALSTSSNTSYTHQTRRDKYLRYTGPGSMNSYRMKLI